MSISSLSNILANSFTKAMLISRCEFSITFAASAIFMDGAKCVPAVIIEEYKLFTISAVLVSGPS